MAMLDQRFVLRRALACAGLLTLATNASAKLGAHPHELFLGRCNPYTAIMMLMVAALAALGWGLGYRDIREGSPRSWTPRTWPVLPLLTCCAAFGLLALLALSSEELRQHYWMSEVLRSPLAPAAIVVPFAHLFGLSRRAPRTWLFRECLSLSVVANAGLLTWA